MVVSLSSEPVGTTRETLSVDVCAKSAAHLKALPSDTFFSSQVQAAFRTGYFLKENLFRQGYPQKIRKWRIFPERAVFRHRAHASRFRRIPDGKRCSHCILYRKGRIHAHRNVRTQGTQRTRTVIPLRMSPIRLSDASDIIWHWRTVPHGSEQRVPDEVSVGRRSKNTHFSNLKMFFTKYFKKNVNGSTTHKR